MDKLKIYTEGGALDLYPNTPFQLTLNGLSIGNLSERSPSYTNVIKLPKSKRNLKLAKYTKISIDIYQGNINLRSCIAYISELSDVVVLTVLTDEVDIFEQYKLIDIDSPSNFKNHGSWSNSDNYANRLGGVANAGAGIVINHGKLNKAPLPNLLNGSFTLGPNGFENWEAGTGWPVVAGSAQYSIPAGGVTTILRDDSLTMYPGYSYTFNFNINIGASVDTYFAFKIGNNLYLNHLTVAGAHSFSITTTLLIENTGIEIYMYRIGGGGATIHSIQDISVATDQNAYISCDAEDGFYRPSFNYMAILPTIRFDLRTLLGSVVNTKLTDITTEQKAFLGSLYVAYTNNKLSISDSYLDYHRVKSELVVPQVYVVTTNQNIQWPIQKVINYGSWDINNEIFTEGNLFPYTLHHYVNVTLQLNVTALTGAGTFVVEVLDGGGVLYTTQIYTTTGIKDISFTAHSLIGGGESLNVRIRKVAGTSASITINTGTFGLELIPEPPITLGSYPYNGVLLPQMTLHEALKDFVTRTGALIRSRYNPANGGTDLQVQFIENIINNKSGAVNWTSKRKKNKNKPITFEYDSFAAINYFQDGEPTINPIARMVLQVLNESIAAPKDYYTSPFDTILDEPVKTVQLANVNGIDKNTSDDLELASNLFDLTGGTSFFKTTIGGSEKTALIKTRRELSTDPQVRFGATIAATYLMGTYCQPADFKDLFWKSLQEALYKPEISTDEYDLTSSDINAFDEWQLIYDDNAYYLLLSLNYTPGQLSKVTKLRVY